MSKKYALSIIVSILFSCEEGKNKDIIDTAANAEDTTILKDPSDTLADQDSMPVHVPRTEDTIRTVSPKDKSKMPVVKPDTTPR